MKARFIKLMEKRLKGSKPKILSDERGQGGILGAGGVVIGLFIIVAVASLILMFTSAVNVQTYTAVKPSIANPGNANISADVNSAVEAGFDATATVAGFQSVIFLALLAAVVIGIFVSFLAIGQMGGGGRGVSF